MKKVFVFSLFWQASTISLCSMLVNSLAQAQPISSDGTLPTPTEVNSTAAGFEINGGTTRGSNLFHSFGNFSVPSGLEAFFNNNSNVVNILNRVTGGNVSDINGLIRANGSANLFLINPAGIVFGEGASLQIGGSFYGSTADSILFPDGVEFSATDRQTEPILTINAPIGLNFRDNPADIKVQGANLAVKPGQNFTLVGGKVNLNASKIDALGGRVELGGLSTIGIVNLDDNLSLGFQEDVAKADVSLSQNAVVNVRSDGGGSITVNANDLELTGKSRFVSGIAADSIPPEAQAGDIVINASDTVSLDQESFFLASVAEEAIGHAGNIKITASSIFLKDNSFLLADTKGQGNAGDIIIHAADDIVLEGSSFQTKIQRGAIGNAGNIEINTGSLSLKGNSQEQPSFLLADSEGKGNAGNVVIRAMKDVSLDDDSLVLSKVSEGEGNAGDITIESDSLFLDGRSFIISNTGDIDKSLDNRGDAGNIDINARLVSLNNFSLITSNSLSNAVGKPGNVNIKADTLSIASGSIVNALTENDFDGGEINIDAQNIKLTNGGKIVTGTDGNGNAGNIILNVAKNITIDGSNPPSQPKKFIEQILQDLESETGLFANTTDNSNGNGGNITIGNPTQLTSSITLSDSGTISAASQGEGTGGTISIWAGDLTLDARTQILAETASPQEEGVVPSEIKLTIDDKLTLRDNSTISARALNDADGGNIDIDADFVIAFPSSGDGNDIIANAAGAGKGGNIDITTNSIFNMREGKATPGNGTNDLDASSEFGLDGNITINTPDVAPFQETRETPENVVETDAVVAGLCDPVQAGSDILAGRENTFVIKGKGGVPPEPTEPLAAESLLFNGQPTEAEEKERSLQELYPPIMISTGPIYPARGIVRNPDGTVILTAYPTDNVSQRSLTSSQNCLGKH